MGDLGKVNVTVEIGGDPPYIDQTSHYTVNDLPAKDAYEHVKKGLETQASNVEFIQDSMSSGYMAVPLRRCKKIANYIAGMPASTTLMPDNIKWTPLVKAAGGTSSASVIGPDDNNFIDNMIKNDAQEMAAPNFSASTKYDSKYLGPRWDIPVGEGDVLPDDKGVNMATPPATPAPPAPPSTTPTTISTALPRIGQEAICEDIWWAIDTTSLSGNDKGTPFYLDIRLGCPVTNHQPTFFMMRVGKVTDGTTDLIDLVFVEGRNPVLFDWGLGKTVKRNDGVSPDGPIRVDLPIPVLEWDNATHRIGFLPMAGRLCISMNGTDYLYTRVNTSTPPAAGGGGGGGSGGGSTPVPAPTPAPALGMIEGPAQLFVPALDTVRLIGTNSIAVIQMSAMVFDKEATFHTPMAGGLDPATGNFDGDLQGDTNGFSTTTPSGTSKMTLPGGVGNTTGAVSGVCAISSNDGTLVANDLWGSAFVGPASGAHGAVKVELAANTDTGGSSNKHYTVSLASGVGSFGETGGSTWYNLCPVWFRMRGIHKGTSTAPSLPGSWSVGSDVLEISESFSSPDRYHTVHSMDITLYNEGGVHDDLINKSLPVQVAYAWAAAAGGSTAKCFTGVIMGGSRALTAGKETITIHCEDYMSILEATLVINSPYYDGMDAFNVVQDLAAKAGIIANDNTDATSRYFLPAGYSFLEPVKWYNTQQTVKECILDVCSLASRIVYFDGDGKLYFDYIQGGVGFTNPTTVANAYVTEPTGAADKHLVLDERRSEMKLNSVVNQIFIKTVDKATRAIVMVSKAAPAASNILSYRKVMYLQEPVLGSYDAAMNMLASLATRVFKPIMGITIKVADDAFILPMTFFSVDGEKYRAMSISKSIRVDDNSITTTLTGEWMGAQGAVP